ncbi:MAG: PEP-CTERM sorting domain-containing protein [Candidatus Brocadiae bacterium]|nr:PEP-CTERM sorting domain-containing protein [Candidatus Brocadiia bacterium]
MLKININIVFLPGVPEPGTFLLLGLAGLFLYLRKK